MAERQLKMGIIGIGVGAAEMLPAIDGAENIDLFAGADIDPDVRARFGERYPNARVYDSAEALCADPDVEAVWISTPNRFHAPMTILAARAGKHVVVEKPMALNLTEAEAMLQACDEHGVKLIAGHTMSFSPPIRYMRQIVRSGALGPLAAINVFAYTDWGIRPRTPDELDPAQGGGIVYRQVPHQIDCIRLIGGGLLRSVRGTTGAWLPGRSITGYYAAYMEFEGGVPAVAVHDGSGYFVASELVPWGNAEVFYDAEARTEKRREMREGTRPEDAEKLALRIGGGEERGLVRGARRAASRRKWQPHDLGILVVSCERGQLRQSPYGVYVYDDDGVRDVTLEVAGATRQEELTELYNAVVLGKPVFHSGAWGMATLEVALGIVESARTNKEIMLTHQVEMDPSYDSTYPVAIAEDGNGHDPKP